MEGIAGLIGIAAIAVVGGLARLIVFIDDYKQRNKKG